jgi:hypothetical protein
MKTLTASVAAAFLIVLVGPVQADTVRDEILSDAQFFDSSACQILNIDFNFPTRVVAHYPFSKGNELRIELAALTGSGDARANSHRREALDPPKDSGDIVSGITYEGSAVPRPYLRLTFRHAVDFKVGQGKDFRSVVVAFRQPQGSGVCEPVYPANDE